MSNLQLIRMAQKFCIDMIIFFSFLLVLPFLPIGGSVKNRTSFFSPSHSVVEKKEPLLKVRAPQP